MGLATAEARRASSLLSLGAGKAPVMARGAFTESQNVQVGRDQSGASGPTSMFQHPDF